MRLHIPDKLATCAVCGRERFWRYGRTMPTCGGTCLEVFKQRSGKAAHEQVNMGENGVMK